jgi:tetratricopeptide (TPR) repeat protein
MYQSNGYTNAFNSGVNCFTMLDRRPFSISFISFLLSIVLCLGAASRVAAEETENVKRARTLFANGVSAFKDGNLERALQAFEEAYQLRPHPTVLINIAGCYDQMGKPIEAISNYEKFLKETQGDTPQRREVKKTLEQLYKKAGAITLNIVPDGSKVLIDRAETKVSPIADPIHLTVGKHTLTITHEGYGRVERDIDVVEGDKREIWISLDKRLEGAEPVVPIAAAPAPAASEPEKPTEVEAATPAESRGAGNDKESASSSIPQKDKPERDSTASGSGVLISGIVTGVLGVGALVCMIAGFGSEAQYDSAVRKYQQSRDEQDKSDAEAVGQRADNLWLATGFLAGGTVVSAAIMVVFLVTESDNSSASLRLEPIVGRGRAGINAVGRF